MESCKNVLITNCLFDAGDDAICLKSGRDEEGRLRGEPSENVIVKDNVVLHGHGGFVIGSEMSGGVKNVYVSGCSFVGTDTGLRFKSARGRGGVVENIYIDNINMIDISGDALTFDLYYMGGGAKNAEILLSMKERRCLRIYTSPMYIAKGPVVPPDLTGCPKCPSGILP